MTVNEFSKVLCFYKENNLKSGNQVSGWKGRAKIIKFIPLNKRLRQELRVKYIVHIFNSFDQNFKYNLREIKYHSNKSISIYSYSGV